MRKKFWLLLLLVIGISAIYIKRAKKDIDYINAA